MTPSSTIGVQAVNAPTERAAVHGLMPTRRRANHHASTAVSPTSAAFANLNNVTLAGNDGNTFHSPARKSGYSGG